MFVVIRMGMVRVVCLMSLMLILLGGGMKGWWVMISFRWGLVL